MAMNSVTLTAAILARLKLLYRNAPATEQEEFDEDYFLTQYILIFAEEIISHIQTSARCAGTDSGGDTHSAVQII